MRIGEIANSAESRVDEQFQNSPIFLVKFWFFKLEKISKVNFLNGTILEIVDFPIVKMPKIFKIL